MNDVLDRPYNGPVSETGNPGTSECPSESKRAATFKPARKNKHQLAYVKFLDSKFWRKLSQAKIGAIKHCEQCGTKKYLQSHHVHYPSDWYQTTLSDLKVLCRKCHALSHGLQRPPWRRHKKRVSQRKFARLRGQINRINNRVQTGPVEPDKPNWVDYGKEQQNHFRVRPEVDGHRSLIAGTANP